MCIHIIIHNMPVTHMSKIIIFFNQINAQHRHDKTFQPQLDAIKFIFPPISLDVVIFAWRVLHRTRIIFCWSFSLEISVGALIKFNCIKNRTILFKLDENCVGTARNICIYVKWLLDPTYYQNYSWRYVFSIMRFIFIFLLNHRLFSKRKKNQQKQHVQKVYGDNLSICLSPVKRHNN